MIEKEWLKLKGMVLDGTESEVQIQDMRNAFYSGVAVMQIINLRIADLSDELAIQILQTTKEEVDAYFLELRGSTA